VEDPPWPSTRLRKMGETADEAARKRRTTLRRLRRRLHGDLNWITMKALEKDRTRRYETANGLAAGPDEPGIVDVAVKLLAAEFNDVSGRGLFAEPELQDVLLSWGESLVVDATGAAKAADKARTGSGELRLAIDLFGAINTGGGGSVDE
jgi:hypothetical protein